MDGSRRRGSRRCIGVLLVAILGASCSPSTPPASPGASSGDPGASPGGSASLPPTASIDPDLRVDVPGPPSAGDPSSADPDEAAAAFAAAVGDGGQAALAPLLGAYRSAGIPVIGPDGLPLGGFEDDAVGPAWWQVWMSAGAHQRVTIPLADAAKLAVAMADAPDLDPATLGDALLADLRTMAGSADERHRVFARFIAARAATLGPDPLDPAARADGVRLDPITTVFLVSGLARSAVIGLVEAEPTSFSLVTPGMAALDGFVPDAIELTAGAPAANPCNLSGTEEQVSYWVQWIASKIAGGTQLPGMQQATKSAVEMIVKNAQTAGRVGKAVAWASGLINALTFLLQVSSITTEIDLSPNPLERTKTTSDGRRSTLTASISFDLKDSGLDGGEGIKNCILVFLNSLGIQASLPSDGAIPGATVIFQGVKGFGQGLDTRNAFVQFSNASELRQDADGDGKARITVEGIRQRREIPDGAGEWPREASVRISATVEAENERSIINTFVDSLTGVAAGGAGLIAPIVDVLKTIRYDLGEQVFLVIDWRLGWRYEDVGFGGSETGTKCDGIGGEWVIQGSRNLAGIESTSLYAITIDEATLKGTFTFEEIAVISGGGGQATTIYNRSGSAVLTIDDAGVATIVLTDTSSTITSSVNGYTTRVDGELDTERLVWDNAGEACPPEG